MLSSRNLPIAIFALANIFSFISIFRNIFPGFLIAVLIILVLLYKLDNVVNVFKRSNHTVFLLLVIFQILSITGYIISTEAKILLSSHPFLIAESFAYLFIPQIGFYYLGSSLLEDQSDKKNDEDIIINVLKRIIFIFSLFAVISLYFHFQRPVFFQQFLIRVFIDAQVTEYGVFYPRLTGYLNSMIVGVIATSMVFLSLHYIENRFYRFLLVSLFVIVAAFTLQRGAWISLAFFLFLWLLFKMSVSTLFKLSFISLTIFVSWDLISLFTVGLIDQNLALEFVKRFDAIDLALNERQYQVENFIYIFENNSMGIGLGMLSHKSAEAGFLYAVPDNNYLRILGEIGIIGFMLFVALIFKSSWRLFQRKSFGLLFIIGVYSVQAIGTNVFDLYMSGFLFWFVLGVANIQRDNLVSVD